MAAIIVSVTYQRLLALGAEEGVGQRRDGRRKAAVINGHHDMDVSVGILQDFNFHLVLFRIELHLACLRSASGALCS